jgi:hypothetical protein
MPKERQYLFNKNKSIPSSTMRKQKQIINKTKTMLKDRLNG